MNKTVIITYMLHVSIINTKDINQANQINTSADGEGLINSSPQPGIINLNAKASLLQITNCGSRLNIQSRGDVSQFLLHMCHAISVFLTPKDNGTMGSTLWTFFSFTHVRDKDRESFTRHFTSNRGKTEFKKKENIFKIEKKTKKL